MDGVKYYIISMPRKARIDYPGLTQHVMARTFSDILLFRDTTDRAYFLSLLSQRIGETGARCYAWALMDTHLHLLLKTSEKPLCCLMKPLNCDYAHYYNKKYNRSGPLFSDRYKSIATQDQLYLEQLVRYIHRNPVRSGICKSVSELDRYPWTGHSALMGIITNAFQDTSVVLRRFGKKTIDARKRYRAFIAQEAHDVTVEHVDAAVRTSNEGRRSRDSAECWVIGDPEFQKSVLKKDTENRLTIARYKKEGLSLDFLVRSTAKKFGVSRELLLKQSKRTLCATARMALCFWARNCGIPSRHIGNHLGIQQAAVSHAARKGERIVKNLGLPVSIV